MCRRSCDLASVQKAVSWKVKRLVSAIWFDEMTSDAPLSICLLFTDNRLSQGIYFFVPLAFLISVNGIFFILTALKIREVQISVKNLTDRGDSHRHQNNFFAEKNKYALHSIIWCLMCRLFLFLFFAYMFLRRTICFSYSLFLRLFIIMGVTWLAEPISWAFAPESPYFLVTDVINQTQGFLIFVLFVLKPEVIQRIRKRFVLSHQLQCATHFVWSDLIVYHFMRIN